MASSFVLSFLFWTGGAGLLAAQEGALRLSASPEAFSPNGDGQKDSTFLFLGTENISHTKRWRIQIRRGRGGAVRVFKGKDNFPSMLEWDGTDKKNRPLPDGPYAISAKVWKDKGTLLSSWKQVAIDNQPPVLEVAVSSTVLSPAPGKDYAPLEITLRAEDSSGGEWFVDILSIGSSGQPYFSAKGPIDGQSQTILWTGTDGKQSRAPNGPYLLRVRAQDSAGNISLFNPVSIALHVDPSDILAALPAETRHRDDGSGMEISLPVGLLFETEQSKQFSEKSQSLRQDLAHYLLGYADKTVSITAASGAKGLSAQERLHLAQAQAWTFYRYLIQAGCSPTRITVKGIAGRRGSESVLVLKLQNDKDVP